MTTTRSDGTAPEPSYARDLLYAARYYLGGRRGLLIFAGLALLAGLALNWNWLAAAGLAPLIIGVLPCVAMCALGLCMRRFMGNSGSTAAGCQESRQATIEETPSGRSVPPLVPPASPGSRPASGGAVATTGTNPESNSRTKGA